MLKNKDKNTFDTAEALLLQQYEITSPILDETLGLINSRDVDFSDIDLCFCALPHKTSQEVIKVLPKHLKIIDLSADFRLQNAAEYEKWYGNAHQALEIQDKAVYGLTEFYRQEIRGARVVAGTGCNAATGQYILRPLVEKGIIDLENIILDLKCAVSGAGRSLKETLLHSELSEGTNAYSVGGVHIYNYIEFVSYNCGLF